MINITTFTPCEIQGTITVKKYPEIGYITDVKGNHWDIKGIMGKYVQAVPASSLHAYYTDTSGNDGQYFDCGSFGSNLVSQTWKPYLIEIEAED